MSAREKASALRRGKMPLFINQSAQELDLYGTVDAAYSSLDSLSYVPFRICRRCSAAFTCSSVPAGCWCSICARRSSCAGWTAACRWTRGRTCSASGAAGLRARALYYGMDIFLAQRPRLAARVGGAHRIRPRAGGGRARCCAGPGSWRSKRARTGRWAARSAYFSQQ